MSASDSIPSYARAGSRDFDRWMSDRLTDLTGDVRRALSGNLVALVLGGGYGRGEGAVVGRGGQERPYNDLDLILIVKSRPGAGKRLEAVSRHHEEAMGIAVDFSRALTVGDVASWEHRLRWHELYHGHQVLDGDPAIVHQHAPRQIALPVPLCEASRLLLNRGAGLVWARRVLLGQEPAPDPDFVRRNAYKALLAVGDAYVIAAGVLAPRHEGRLELLRAFVRQFPPSEAALVTSAYASALAFKFEPDSMPAGSAVAELLDRATALWSAAFLRIESQRHGIAWTDLASYARWSGPREPAPARRWLRNLGSNLRFGQLSVRAPQERLYTQVAHLLDPATGQSGSATASAAFLNRWRKVND